MQIYNSKHNGRCLYIGVHTRRSEREGLTPYSHEILTPSGAFMYIVVNSEYTEQEYNEKGSTIIKSPVDPILEPITLLDQLRFSRFIKDGKIIVHNLPENIVVI